MSTPNVQTAEALLHSFLKRYGTTNLDALRTVMVPALLPIKSLDKEIVRLGGQKHYRASFEVDIASQFEGIIQTGRTGKFVPLSYLEGGSWKEIAKGRILSLDSDSKVAKGEVYFRNGGNKAELISALEELSVEDYLEIDQFGASAKILSGLVEYALAEIASKSGFKVVRMPEDMAKHLGTYANYDFEFSRDNITRKVEVKSLWGTDTRKARLIHSTNKTTHLTSSCKFETQDIFAVSLFLRTGNVYDFAFAKSLSSAVSPNGLPFVSEHPSHVSQNPVCDIGDGIWYAKIEEVWN